MGGGGACRGHKDLLPLSAAVSVTQERRRKNKPGNSSSVKTLRVYQRNVCPHRIQKKTVRERGENQEALACRTPRAFGRSEGLVLPAAQREVR